MLSAVVYKINKRSKKQERSLLVTTKAIYNISKQNIMTQMIALFASSFQVKRKIDIGKLSAITVSDMSSEFIIHVCGEYDYRYSCNDRRNQILLMMTRAYYLNIFNKSLPFFFKVFSQKLLLFFHKNEFKSIKLVQFSLD